MAARLDLPPALRALVDVGVGLARRAPSSRIAIVRAGEAVELSALPPELREAVEREVAAARESACQELLPKEIERLLKDAWGRPAGKVLDDLDPEPLAVRPASQVHRASVDGTDVAVKVRRPGVERAVRNDLALLDAVGPPLRAAFPRLDAAGVLRDLRELTLDELDFEHEASQQRRVARALRDVPGIDIPRPHLELCESTVLVSDLLDGETLAGGARPADPAAAAGTLVRAFRAAAVDAGLAPIDPRPSHVLIRPDGQLGLLGAGVARPVDRERAQQALDALGALDGDEPAEFARIVEAAGLLPAAEAGEAHAVLRELLSDFLAGPTRLDAAALLDLADTAITAAPDLFALASAAAPQPQDLALGRMLGQLLAVIARLEVTEDWLVLARS